MKIGIDGRAANWYRGTGIGTYTYQLINHINKLDQNNDYTIFMPYKCANKINFNTNFTINEITEKCSNNFWDEVNIPNILKGKNIDLYHVPQNGIGLPVEKNCSFVITLHDVIPYKMPETVSPRYLKLFNETLPKLVSLCDGIITVSDYSKKDIMKTFKLPEDKIFVTYLSSEDIYKPLDKNISKAIIKKEYSISSKYILYVGGFSPRKNILGIIEAFSKLIPLYKEDIKLVVAGKKGTSYSIYKKRCNDLHIEDKVIFPGFIDLKHLPYLYNGCELFIYPSFYEGFGLPPIEAMACGVPVITSNTTSIPEVVCNAACTVNPNDIDMICTKMLHVLLDKNFKQTLRKKGLIRASDLTWSNTAKSTIDAYKKIINN